MTYGRSASLTSCQAPARLQDKIFVTVRQLRVCYCGAPSLLLGQVCRVLLLLILASAVILWSQYHGFHDHILLSQIRGSPLGRSVGRSVKLLLGFASTVIPGFSFL
jgi:hypothetical protein